MSEITNHLLAELLDGFLRFLFVLAISELCELLGEGSSAIREAEATARASTDGAVLANNPADLRRTASEIHDQALHLHEATCDAEGTDVTFFFLIKKLHVKACGRFDRAQQLRRVLGNTSSLGGENMNLILLDLEIGTYNLEASYSVAHAIDNILGNGNLFARFVVELSIVQRDRRTVHHDSRHNASHGLRKIGD